MTRMLVINNSDGDDGDLDNNNDENAGDVREKSQQQG